ncbi:ArdC family protein [Helicobacter sp. MIT 01-3238]|uniref:ArdC family protein n=1 Tax=Helicobacter sp. MIT 01-3238 TaxID=398627 RepID=UPI000E1E76BD|nr:ArdC family protein [Helicobacter sp. MIT 01-3238]RDU52905.1 hypothetical protein CQA40_06275 [Helicobacter sp. MIT 01-3238]
MENAKVDYKQIIEQKKAANAELIIRTLANGTSPLLRTSDKWVSAFRNNSPVTSTNYRGVNDLLLESKAAEQGKSNTSWFTFNQAKELGAQIKKGEKGQEVLFYHRGRSDEEIKDLLAKLDELGEPHPSQEEIAQLQKTYIKSFTVFGHNQVDFSKADMEVVDALTTGLKPSIDIEESKLLQENFDRALQDDLDFQHHKDDFLPEHIQLLKEQIAKFIVVRASNAEFDSKKEDKYYHKKQAGYLEEYAQNGKFSKDDVLLALKEGRKLAQRVLPTMMNNTLEELQVNQAQKAFNFIKDNMKEKGKGYYSPEIWKELFAIEKETLKVVSSGYSADVNSKRLDRFLESLNEVESKKQQTPTQSAADKIRAMPKPTQEERQKARAFLDAAKAKQEQASADNKNVAESVNVDKSVKSEEARPPRVKINYKKF